MKLHKPDIKIESQGIRSTTRFTIEATSQSFGVLSSTIYEDKIKAPVRELSTNAYDAHVEAGCPEKPFDVHLPNALDPEFRVRDYGVSMSHDQIMNLYTTYFASNKRDSNELNGCLGLGSKSPFAYTNQFWVTAYKDGKKRHYVATVDVDGPRFDEYPSCDTDEEDGFEVGFTVKEDDYGIFKDKAEEVYEYFKTQPNVDGCDFEHLEPREHKIEGSFWRYLGLYDDSVAIMGNIAYPIDQEYFHDRDADYWSKRNNKYCKMLHACVHIDFEIGELSMTASREGLEYTDEVVQAIKDKLDIIYDEMQDNVNNEFHSCESLYEARVKLSQYDNVFRNLEGMIFPKWTNEKGDEVEVSNTFSVGANSQVSVGNMACHSIRYDNRVKMTRDVYTFHFGNKYKFFINDMAIGGQAASKYYVQNNPDHIVFLIHAISDEDLDTLCSEIGIDEQLITRTSELERPPRQKRGGSSRRARRVDVDAFAFSGDGNCYHTSLYDGRYWSPTTKNLSDGQENVYVELHRYCVCDHGDTTEQNPRSLIRLTANLEKLGIKMPVIYGFPSGKAARVRSAKNWTHLYDWAKQKFQEYVDEGDIATIIKNDAIIGKMELGEGLVKLRNEATVVLLDGYFKKVSDMLIKIQKTVVDGGENLAQAIKDVSSFLAFKLPNCVAESWAEREKHLIESYPVLSLYELDRHWRLDKEDANLIVKCINDHEIAKLAKELV